MADPERQLAVEGAQRFRVAAFALVAGLLFFGGEVWISAIGASEPTVGLLQGLIPAFHGHAAAATDPRTIKELFLVHNQFALIAAFVVSNLGVLAMIVPLRFLAGAESARAERPSALTGYLAIAGPVMLGIFLPAFEISLIIGAHSYISHGALTAAAVTAATGGGVRVAMTLILTIGTLLLAVVFIMLGLRAMRVGLLTRMMGIVGIISGVLFLIPITPLPVIQALWLVFFGAMLLSFGGRPLPEAWTSGEARPWPPRQPPAARQPRGQRGQRRGFSPAPPPVPAPSVPRGPSPSASKKRKRRR
jgi:hypothetical protein